MRETAPEMQRVGKLYRQWNLQLDIQNKAPTKTGYKGCII